MPRSFFACCLIFVLALAAPFFVLAQADKPKADITRKELSALLEKAKSEQDVPALAAGIVRGGAKPLVSVVGVRKRDSKVAAAVGDQWHLGSNTKPMTALLIALLIDEGLLDWDTRLEEIFPELAEKWSEDMKKITIAQILTHTSGLPSLGPILGFLINRKEAPPTQDRDRLMKSLDTVKMAVKPGEKYEYSNLGYVVLGAIIDKRGKRSWEEQIEQKLFKPLGIKDWGLGPAVQKESVVQPWPHHNNGKPVPADSVMDNPPVMNSAGRIRLTVADYNRYLAETLRLSRGEKGLLKPATAKKLFTKPYPVSPHSLSGWAGLRKKKDDNEIILIHNGSNTFNYCTAVVIPDENRAFCVLTNQGTPGGAGEKACQQVSKELKERVPDHAPSDKPKPSSTSEILTKHLAKAKTEHDVPALAAGIVRGDGKPLVAVVGVRERGTDIAATVDDQWHIGSNTKPMTALLTALLIDEGLLNWDMRLEEIFPDRADKWNEDLKKITIAQLLTHTSGLPSDGPTLGFILVCNDTPPMQDRESLVKLLDTVKSIAKPGEKYQYSNLGYVVLGAIIDRRGKKSWEEQIEQKIFKPLGIKDWGLGSVVKKDPVVQPWPHRSDGKPVSAHGVMDNPPVANSAGRIRLTVADYNRFLAETLRLVRGEKGLLKPATARKFFTRPCEVSPHNLSGWLGDKEMILSHDGSNAFNYCTAVVIPDRNRAYCVLTNQGAPDGPGDKACQQIGKELKERE